MIFILFLVALAASAIGFRKYIWFISIGYGFAIAAIGLALLVLYGGRVPLPSLLPGALFLCYGIRLGGYLAFREWKVSSYNKKMQSEIKDGKGMSFLVKCALWLSVAILYVCETAPAAYRLENGKGADAFLVVGCLVMVLGLGMESAADVQKNKAKKRNPGRFVDTGLYRLVRCPNYLGEMLFWTGVFILGLNSNRGVLQWLLAILGYVGIIYVMFSGARRLELRQDKTYGNDPEYRNYKKTTPIMVPFIPLYSVEKYKWLVA